LSGEGYGHIFRDFVGKSTIFRQKTVSAEGRMEHDRQLQALQLIQYQQNTLILKNIAFDDI
jgi:hypothetical protein